MDPTPLIVPVVPLVSATIDWAPIINTAFSLLTLLAAALLKWANDRSNEHNTALLKESGEKHAVELRFIHGEINNNLKTALAREYERGQRDQRDDATAAVSLAESAAQKVVQTLRDQPVTVAVVAPAAPVESKDKEKP